MSRKRALQTIDARTEQRQRVDEAGDHPRSPYLTARETIDYLRLGSQSALYRLVREHQLPTCRRGRLYLFDRRELDAWVKGFSSALDLVRAKRSA